MSVNLACLNLTPAQLSILQQRPPTKGGVVPVRAIKQRPPTKGRILVNGIAQFPVWMPGAHATGALDDENQCRGTLHAHVQLFPGTASLQSGSHSPGRKRRVIINDDDDDDVVAAMDSTDHMATGPGNSQSPPPINDEPVQMSDNDNMPALLSDSDSDSDDSSDSGSSLLDFIDTAEPAVTLLQEKTLMRFFPITCKKNIDNGV